MRKQGSLLFDIIRVLGITVLGALLIVLRYLLKTPQPLESLLPGESRLFKWTHGHVFYKVLGVPDAPSLVLLHAPEIGGSSYEFCALAEQLAQQYHVYALDLLGFGLSDRPSIHYTGETYTTLCQDFLTQIVLQPAIVVASGLSCNYAIALATRQPQLCERLVLLSPHALISDVKQQESVMRVLQQPLLGLCVYSLLTTRIILRDIIARQKQVQHISESELDYIYASSHQLGAHHAVVALLSGHLQRDVSLYKETLRTPTLLLWGANIASADWSVAEFYAANDVIQETLIQDVGVRPHQEQPAEVATHLAQWRNKGLEVLRYTKEYENISAKEDTMKETNEHVEAYCVKCKEKRVMKDPTDTTTKNGRSAKTGSCPVCGTKLFRFVGN